LKGGIAPSNSPEGEIAPSNSPEGGIAPSNSPDGGELFPSFGGVRGGCGVVLLLPLVRFIPPFKGD